jgi:ribosomal protein S18 acetylase RimI-like enzyme
VLKRLRDGSPVLIRPIRADDKRLLEDGLSHLSRTSIQRRFLSPKPRFTKTELRYLTEVDGWNHVALVAEAPTQPARHLIAVARYVRDPLHPESAEAAIVVGDEFQRRGLGSLLAEELAQHARVRGIRSFTATMASENQPAQRLLAKLTGHLERHHAGQGVSELTADLAA